jgi:nitroimidazol reductase NimA-like FMN-containing flavoprotein (pyridoxamine 5'-phosphate oxidase superfamily)
MATDPRSGVTILEAHTCWMLLRSSGVKRLAVSVADHPDIFPINYDRSRTMCSGPPSGHLNVAFEADGAVEAGEA